MRILLLILSINTYLLAAPAITPETMCYKIKDDLDRDYCKKKKISLIENKYSSDIQKWKSGISEYDKKNKASELDLLMKEKQELIEVYTKELALLKNHQNELNKAKIIKPKKKKKKKKKNELEEALKNIKL